MSNDRLPDQPSPVFVPGGPSMHDLVIDDLLEMGPDWYHLSREYDPVHEVIQDLAERRDIGLDRYKVPLQAGNDRNWRIDCMQEIYDAVCYARQGVEETAGGSQERMHANQVYKDLLRLTITMRKAYDAAIAGTPS